MASSTSWSYGADLIEIHPDTEHHAVIVYYRKPNERAQAKISIVTIAAVIRFTSPSFDICALNNNRHHPYAGPLLAKQLSGRSSSAASGA